jgi:integrase
MGFHAGRPPRNEGLRYPADPPKVRRSSPSCAPRATVRTAAGAARADRRPLARRVCGSTRRLRSPRPISISAAAQRWLRRGKGGRRREVGIDAWGWDELEPRL